MEYNDNIFPTPDKIEEMAKAYSSSLREQGFLFIKLNNEEYSFLIDEVFDILFKLRSSYRFMKGFMNCNLLLELNERQIDKMRRIFDYKTNHAFQVKTNKTKCFINSISLENKLFLKVNELAQKSEKFLELSSIINERLPLLIENYHIEGIFNNFSNLSF